MPSSHTAFTALGPRGNVCSTQCDPAQSTSALSLVMWPFPMMLRAPESPFPWLHTIPLAGGGLTLSGQQRPGEKAYPPQC